MKTRFIISLVICGQLGFSQTVIKLSWPRSSQADYQRVNLPDYQLVNLSDSALITIKHSEDMGVWYGHRYELKNDCPDGEYEIYVDDTLELRAFYRNHHKDSIWTYYKSGQLWRTEEYRDGQLNADTVFYKSGKVKVKNYFENGKHLKREEYNEDGKIERIYIPPN